MTPMKPIFQMPFRYNQKWRASTYDNPPPGLTHWPNPNSIDLGLLVGSSAGQAVYASAAGTVTEARNTKADVGGDNGSRVTIDHGNGWETYYLHLNDALSVQVNEPVVRGQKLGVVGDIPGMAPHLHYTQLQSGIAVRVAFNGVDIDVHWGAKKADGSFPTQDLISKNQPTGVKVQELAKGTSATCQAGAGLRATLVCINTHNEQQVIHRGPWVGAQATSTVKCTTATHQVDDHGSETS